MWNFTSGILISPDARYVYVANRLHDSIAWFAIGADGALTFAGEAVGIGIAFHVSPLRVLDAAFDFDAGIRPGWQVLAAGLGVVVVDFVRARWNSRTARSRAIAAE